MNWLDDRVEFERQVLWWDKGDDTATLGPRALRVFKEHAFARIAAKVQVYVELSLALRREYVNFDGLTPSELATNSDSRLVPVLVLPNDADRTWIHRITAIDQAAAIVRSSPTDADRPFIWRTHPTT